MLINRQVEEFLHIWKKSINVMIKLMDFCPPAHGNRLSFTCFPRWDEWLASTKAPTHPWNSLVSIEQLTTSMDPEHPRMGCIICVRGFKSRLDSIFEKLLELDDFQNPTEERVGSPNTSVNALPCPELRSAIWSRSRYDKSCTIV